MKNMDYGIREDGIMVKKLKENELDGFLEAAKIFYENCHDLYEKEREEYFRKKHSDEGNLTGSAINCSIYVLLDKQNDIMSNMGIFNDFKSLLEAAENLQDKENLTIYEVRNLNSMNSNFIVEDSSLSMKIADFYECFRITANPNRTMLKETYADKSFKNLLTYLWQYIMDQYDVISRGDEALGIYKAYLTATKEVLSELAETCDVLFYRAICETAIKLFENIEE